MDKHTKEVLDIINKIRVGNGLRAIDDLPKGNRGKSHSCPIHNALVELNTEAYGAFGLLADCGSYKNLITEDEMQGVVTWIYEFDDGMYSRYDDNWEPSDDDIYRNNPHVHADAYHPKDF
jgi:hypothetical protein